MTVWPGATGEVSWVRAPFQTTVPAAVETWYASANLSAGSHVSDPLFNTATGIVTALPAADASAGICGVERPPNWGPTTATVPTVICTPRSLDHAPPSFTTSPER